MIRFFKKEKRPRPEQSGFREFDAFIRETPDSNAPPVPAAGIVMKDELPELLQVKTMYISPEDPAIVFGAIPDGVYKAGIRFRDARPVLLSERVSWGMTYERLAAWIREHDTGHLLCGENTGDPQILNTIYEVLKILRIRNEIPEMTYRLYEGYVWFGIECRFGRFYDRKTGQEMTMEAAIARETETRLYNIRANMDRAGCPEEMISRKLEDARADIREFYRSLTENPVREGTALGFRTDDGTEYRFVWSGVMQYYPNKGSRSGYDSDDWMYLCRMDDRDWILLLSYGPEAVWVCLPIPETDAEQIRRTAGEALHSVYYANRDQNKVILHLHPEDVGQIAKIVIPDYHRNGLLTDSDLYGK